MLRLLLFLTTMAFLSGSALEYTKDITTTNGRLARKGEFPEIVLLHFGETRCVGTIIGPRVILTSAHCANEFTRASFQVHQNQYRATFIQSPFWHNRQHDIAIGISNRNIAGATYASIGGYLQTGMNITMAGYGCTKQGGIDGSLRVGTTTYRAQPSSLYFTAKRAALCFGTSGSPAFMDLNSSTGQAHYVTGILSMIDPDTMTKYLLRTDTNESRIFFDDVIKQHNVEICGVNVDCFNGPDPEPDPYPDPTPLPEPTPQPSPSPLPEPTPEPSPDPGPDPSPDPAPDEPGCQDEMLKVDDAQRILNLALVDLRQCINAQESR